MGANGLHMERRKIAMSTNIRPSISDKNVYRIEKHRYYELMHFCLQYPIWKKAYAALTDLSSKPAVLLAKENFGHLTDPTAKCAEARLYYSDRIKMIENTAEETDHELSNYILKAVTEGKTYDTLRINTNIPCGKNAFYKLYRRFFWLLNKERQ